jgi:hypothetical protein
MNIQQLKAIVKENKSLLTVSFGLVFEGILILASLRIAGNFVSQDDYSQLTVFYSILSILSFGLFAGLEQTRQSSKSSVFNIYSSFIYSIISILLILPLIYFIMQRLGINIKFSFFIIFYGISYALQFEYFGYLSLIDRPKEYSQLKFLDGFMKLSLVTLTAYLGGGIETFFLAYSIAPFLALCLFIIKTKIKFEFFSEKLQDLNSYTFLTMQNFICIFYLYGIPLVESLRNSQSTDLVSDLFFAQSFGQVLQFSLAPIQFIFLPALTKKYISSSNLRINDVFKGTYLALLICSAYLSLTYLFGDKIIKLLFFENFKLPVLDTISIVTVSVIILIIKTSSFYLIVTRRTKFIVIGLLSGFILLVFAAQLTNISTSTIFLSTSIISLLSILFINVILNDD